MVTLAQILADFPQLAADAALPPAPIPVSAVAVDSRRCAPGPSRASPAPWPTSV